MNTRLPASLTCAAVIVAAGRGTRAGGPLPKQFARLNGVPVLRTTFDVFNGIETIRSIVVVHHPDDRKLVGDSLEGQEFEAVHGGETRQDSVCNGLMALRDAAPDIVLIHDAARPFVSETTILRSIQVAQEVGGAVTAVPVADTLKRVGENDEIEETVPREDLWRAQTPQTFRFNDILAAHEAVAGRNLTDDAAVAERAGIPVVVVPGQERNFKITTPEDLERAERMACTDRQMIPIVGQGFDVHAFEPGDHVWLCGVRIDHSEGLKGHSDADVALHALTDAILGAMGAGDIGQHFPDTDPAWSGASSDRFLKHAVDLAEKANGRLNNVDITIICERPKLSPHRAAMLKNLSDLTGLPENRIGLKATTSEKLGFTGRGEGIAAMATVSLSVPA